MTLEEIAAYHDHEAHGLASAAEGYGLSIAAGLDLPDSAVSKCWKEAAWHRQVAALLRDRTALSLLIKP